MFRNLLSRLFATAPLHAPLSSSDAEVAVAALLALLALVTLALKTFLEWRHGDALAASGH